MIRKWHFIGITTTEAHWKHPLNSSLLRAIHWEDKTKITIRNQMVEYDYRNVDRWLFVHVPRNLVFGSWMMNMRACMANGHYRMRYALNAKSYPITYRVHGTSVHIAECMDVVHIPDLEISREMRICGNGGNTLRLRLICKISGINFVWLGTGVDVVGLPVAYGDNAHVLQINSPSLYIVVGLFVCPRTSHTVSCSPKNAKYKNERNTLSEGEGGEWGGEETERGNGRKVSLLIKYACSVWALAAGEIPSDSVLNHTFGHRYCCRFRRCCCRRFCQLFPLEFSFLWRTQNSCSFFPKSISTGFMYTQFRRPASVRFISKFHQKCNTMWPNTSGGATMKEKKTKRNICIRSIRVLFFRRRI